MKKMALMLALVAVFLAVGVGVALALFADQHVASGTVGMATADVDLYICEPGSTPGPDCGSDDNGHDEAVWETTEQLLPGYRPPGTSGSRTWAPTPGI